MFERAAGAKRLVVVEGAGHVDLERAAPGQYQAEVMSFLELHMTRGDTSAPAD
jgi:fermentation-respiration switch protein FrsA (DUF1100 family)